MRIGSWALVCEFMLAAETLGELLRKGEYILPSYTTEMVDDTVNVTLNTYVGDNDPDHFLVEFMALA